jgi:FkbM family methyltransferase
MLSRRARRGAPTPTPASARAEPSVAPPALDTLEALAADPVVAADVVTVATDVGELLLHADDEVMTPIIRAHGRWEEDEAIWMNGLLRPGQTVIDCGANVGYFSLLASRAVGPAGRVLAFEPERANLRLLRHNLWRNGADNVQVVPAAAGDARTPLALRFNAANRGDHQVHAEAQGTDVLVPSVVIDELLPTEAVDVVKVDTQGSDHVVIAGMRQLLDRSPGAHVLVEFWLDAMEDRGVRPADVLADYRALGRPMGMLEPGGSVTDSTDGEIVAAAQKTAPVRFVNVILGPRS